MDIVLLLGVMLLSAQYQVGVEMLLARKRHREVVSKRQHSRLHSLASRGGFVWSTEWQLHCGLASGVGVGILVAVAIILGGFQKKQLLGEDKDRRVRDVAARHTR